ncbi:MAG TPA: DUF4384 domain-containing protein [Bacillota bacterium]|nr:DUF4384 domain-containing protein [Bacillota bacterium]HOH10182.1 DUF4384 domain-containing protein [Bacillota bacterium]HOY89638.1 DUF4384 domain-containing protein [Bacillota bacterium]HPI01836.1 DUF4384 domain-containing protein [Bacillota bacterium]HPM63603.1 DUF4384 domain-containing protein [Bacillota bacterium]
MKTLRLTAALALLLVAMLATGIAAANTVPSVNSIIINPNPPFQSSIWTDKSSYSIGDRISIGFRVNKDSYAYVFSIDASGIVRMIFPNIYSSNNKLKANQAYYLPDNSKYNLTVGGPAGTDQLVLISTPSKFKDTEWLRSSLEQSSFAPQININISADGFMAQIKSVVITPVFKNDWSSAYTSYNVGTWVNVPAPVTPPIVTPPVVVPPISVPIAANGRINVTSSPSGARVFLNGVEQASTPANFTGLEFGEYEITVIYPGYRTFTRTVSVNSSSVQYVYAELTAIRNQNASGKSIFAKQIDLSWPSVGPFTESFSYAGYYWNVTLRADSILGMLTKVNATASVQGGSQVQFAEFTPSGANAAYRSKVVEYQYRPFTFRITVLDVNNTTGSLTGSSYIESIKLYLEVFYTG